MGRAEKYADVIEKYEDSLKKLEEAEEKLSTTRELKFGELQKEIDNSVTIADYEEMEQFENPPKRKKITDTNEIQIEEVPSLDTEEIEVVDDDTKEIVEEPVKPAKKAKKKEDTAEVKIIDEPTEELIATNGESSDALEDDLYLTKSINPINKKFKLSGFFKALIVLVILALIGVFVFFKFIKPLYFNIVNSDPFKMFNTRVDDMSEEFVSSIDRYANGEEDIVNFNIKAKVDSNIDNFGNDSNVTYNVSYGYNPGKKQMISSVSVSRGETYSNTFVMDNKMVYQKLSSYDRYIKLEDYTGVLKDNNYYKEHKDEFNNLIKYILPSDYSYYVKEYAGIIKNSFEENMFSKDNYKLERKEVKINVIRNTLTLNTDQLKIINDKINDKKKNDSRFKKAYDIVGNLLDTSKKKLIINIYTKINNKVVGYDVEADGFTTSYYYLLNDKEDYDAHFTIKDNKYDVVRRDNVVNGALNGNELSFELKFKEDSDTKKIFDFEIKKEKRTYTGSLELSIDKALRKDTFDLKIKNGEKYFNAVGSLDYSVNNEVMNVDLTNMIDPPMREYNQRLEEFKNSFSANDLYLKYESWYKFVTDPKLFTF